MFNQIIKMNILGKKIFLGAALLSIFTFVSCSKSEGPDGPSVGGKGAITMEIDGKSWASNSSYLITYPADDEDDVYGVFMTGSNLGIAEEHAGTSTDGLILMLGIAPSKYRNPVGTYEVGDEHTHFAHVMYNEMSADGETNITYISDDGKGGSMGTITIEKFKIGDQTFLGESLGEGYTELSGTFSVKLNGYNAKTGEMVKAMNITKGKFQLKSGLKSGGLFGQTGLNKPGRFMRAPQQ